MASEAIERREMAVLSDRRTAGGPGLHDWEGAQLRHWDVSEGFDSAFSAALVGEPSVLIVDGDDRLLSEVVTELRRRGLGRQAPRILPLATGRYRTVADRLGAPGGKSAVPKRVVRRLSLGRWSARRLPTVRVVPSTEAAPLWGFNFGAGIVYSLFEAHHRSGGEGLSALGGTVGRMAREFALSGRESLEARSGRVSIDWEPWAESVGYLVVSGLAKSWLGLRPGDDEVARWVGGSAGGDFVKRLARSRALPGFLGGRDGESFERIHIDWSGGFVLDGVLHEPGGAYVVEVTPGRAVELVAL